MKRRNSIVAALLTMTLCAPANAVIIYTDRASWNADVVLFTTETFDNTIADADVITLDNGIVSTQVPGGQSAGLNNVNVSGAGAYVGRVGDTSHPQQIRWDLPSGIGAWFADFGSLNANGLTVFGDWDGTGVTKLDIAQTVGSSSGGFGIIGAASFSTFSWDTDDSSEFFSVDNFSQAQSPAVVSEPSILLLLSGGGLIVLGAIRRRA